MSTNSFDFIEALLLTHQMLLNLELDLARNLERRSQEHVQGVIDRPLGRVLDRNHAEVSCPAFDLLESLINGMKRQRTHGMAKVLVDGRLRERTFRAEKTDLEGFLLRQAR